MAYDRDHHSPPSQPESPPDGVNRRGFLECMAWVGTGLIWTVAGGVLSSRALAQPAADQGPAGQFSFVQISDTHIGFNGDANPDVLGTFHEALAKINALDPPPAFVLHTGDLSHTQKPGSFDTVSESLKGLKTGRAFYVPGENDVFADGGKEYLKRFGQDTVDGRGWHSFDYRGVHFVGLVTVLLQGGPSGRPRGRAARVAGEGCREAREQHADRGLCSCAALGRLPSVGVGHWR